MGRKAYSLGQNIEVFNIKASIALVGAQAALALPSAKLAINL